MMNPLCTLRAFVVLTAVALLLAAPAVAQADFIGNLITIEADNADGRGTWQLAVPPNPPDVIDYMHPDVIELRDQDQMLIGTIDDLTVHLEGDPVVSLSFIATAGSFPTTFTISSAVVSFPAISNPTGNASASVTLTDSATNGATLMPVTPNTGVFLPTYNGSTLFFPLIGPQTISSGGSVTATEATGDQPIAGSVSSIQARFHFTLSAMDVANGTGRFEVIPEPATVWLLGIAGTMGIVAIQRRKRVAR